MPKARYRPIGPSPNPRELLTLAAMRERVGLRQADVAARLGIKHASGVSRIERGGASVPVTSLLAYAAALGGEFVTLVALPGPDGKLALHFLRFEDDMRGSDAPGKPEPPPETGVAKHRRYPTKTIARRVFARVDDPLDGSGEGGGS